MRQSVVLGLLLLVPSTAVGQWTELNVPARPVGGASSVEAGREIYDRHCWYCHGENGDGLGPIAEYLWPRPRDFQIASFKLRTTPSGELPTDEDLFRTITLGARGTAMPAWESVLTVEERWQVIAYVKAFGDGIFEDPAFDPYELVIAADRPPRESERDLVEAGRAVYEASDCWECHGAAGRGDGPKADQLTDDWGLPIRATDLELAWKFRGGRTPRDVYVRLSTGLDGTPMPSYTHTLSEDERWQVAYYVASLAVDTDGAGRVVIPAMRVDGALPEDLTAGAWDSAATVWIPLTGQATYPPRWQVPSVTDLAVQALYDADEIAIRVEWNDPMADSAQETDGRAEAEGRSADDSYPVVFPGGERRRGRYRDELEVLFPAADLGPVLPHFVYGDSRRPVRLWRWTSVGTAVPEPGTVEELRAAGPEKAPEPLSADQQRVTARGSWVDGRWTVVLRRPLAGDGPFRPGALVPVAFHVRDGGHGETGLRMSLSSWYFLHVREPTGPREVLLVLLVVLLTAGAECSAVLYMRRLAAAGRLSAFGISPR